MTKSKIRLRTKMNNYSKTEALKFMKEKYKIAVAIKDWERPKSRVTKNGAKSLFYATFK